MKGIRQCMCASVCVCVWANSAMPAVSKEMQEARGSSQHVVVNPRNVTLCFAFKVCVCVLAGLLKTTLYLLVCCLATLRMCPLDHR